MQPTSVILFGALIATSFVYGAATPYENDGQPGCKSVEELDIGIFRNFWDPTSYWKCFELGEPAILLRCPDQNAFLDSIKDCVSWPEWRWEEPVAPLSTPDENANYEMFV